MTSICIPFALSVHHANSYTFILIVLPAASCALDQDLENLDFETGPFALVLYVHILDVAYKLPIGGKSLSCCWTGGHERLGPGPGPSIRGTRGLGPVPDQAIRRAGEVGLVPDQAIRTGKHRSGPRPVTYQKL